MTSMWMPFSAYMQEALYGPKGYYMIDRNRFGKSGDFFTSAQVSPVFGEIWASFVMQKVAEREYRIVEFGPGDGDFAISLLTALLRMDERMIHYAGIEVSPAGRERLADKLQELRDTASDDRLDVSVYGSLDELKKCQPDAWDGCFVFANEWLDAFPCDVLRISRNGLVESLWVSKTIETPPPSSDVVGPFQGEHLQTEWKESRDLYLLSYVKEWMMPLFQDYEEDQMVAEVSLESLAAVMHVVEKIRPRVMALIDYGGYTIDVIGPDRPNGSLRAYRDHQLVDHFLDWQGLVDLTYDVDFSPVISLLQQMEYGTSLKKQGMFLVTQPFFERIVNERAASDPRVYQAIKTLVLPGGMGERFFVLLAERGYQK